MNHQQERTRHREDSGVLYERKKSVSQQNTDVKCVHIGSKIVQRQLIETVRISE
jgi:hypothetical protein